MRTVRLLAVHEVVVAGADPIAGDWLRFHAGRAYLPSGAHFFRLHRPAVIGAFT
jgi:hypothetical protein